jgi:hypothetical protein
MNVNNNNNNNDNKKLGIETAGNWYSHISKAVCVHEDVTVLWNQGYKQVEKFWP